MQLTFGGVTLQVNQVVQDTGEVSGLYVGSPDDLRPERWHFIPAENATGTDAGA